MISRRYPLVAAAVATTLISSRLLAADAAAATDSTAAAATAAAAAEAGGDDSLNAVIVTGTRQSGIKAIDSAAPIQVIGSESIEKTASSPDLIQTLAAQVPSLQATTYGGDLSNITLQAALRGLSPNDTLVLVDGKRRHTTANLALGGSGGFGLGAGVDINQIPVDAIDHIEVLTDGAAAQYGSDAIAGVINIILKKDASGGNLQAQYGAYQAGDGQTDDVSGDIGFQPYDGAYINLSAEWRKKGYAFSGGIDPRVYETTPAINQNMQYVPGWPSLNHSGGEGGSAAQNAKLVALNSGFRLTDDVEFYAQGTWGQKDGSALQNYRIPNQVSWTDSAGVAQYPYPYGFSPVEAIRENDYQLTGGLRGTLSGWHWDVSSGYGRDWVDVYTDNSTNTSILADNAATANQTGSAIVLPPVNYYDGSFKATQWSNTIDVNRDFDVGLAGPLNVAFGGEYRRETYAIYAGNEASWTGVGATAYPGFAPDDAGIHSRDNKSAYLDFAAEVLPKLHVDVAGRFEDYSDFGSKTVGKLTARYDFTPELALRGTVSTGFRAPTLAEEWYTTISVSPTTATVRLAPNSPGAAALGLGSGLKPETSTNYSLGLVFKPLEHLTGTLDVYQIDLHDRIVGSGGLNAYINGVLVSPAIENAIVANNVQIDTAQAQNTSVSLDVNGFDSRTRGLDFTLDYLSDFDRFGKVDWSLNTNLNSTTVSNVRPGTDELDGQPLVNAVAVSSIEAYPKFQANLGGLWTWGPLSINLREVIYGNTSNYVSDGGATAKADGSATQYISYYKWNTGVHPTTNVDISYEVLKSLRFSVGGTNVFNRYPDQVPAALEAAYVKTLNSVAASIYPNFSPFGIYGGYYYVRAAYTF